MKASLTALEVGEKQFSTATSTTTATAYCLATSSSKRTLQTFSSISHVHIIRCFLSANTDVLQENPIIPDWRSSSHENSFSSQTRAHCAISPLSKSISNLSSQVALSGQPPFIETFLKEVIDGFGIKDLLKIRSILDEHTIFLSLSVKFSDRMMFFCTVHICGECMYYNKRANNVEV